MFCLCWLHIDNYQNKTITHWYISNIKNQSIHFGLIVNEQKNKYLRCSKEICLNDIDINSEDLEKVKLYKYLGSILNGDNSSEVDIKQITAMGNSKIFKSKLLSKKDKLQLYWTITRPAIPYASETWVPKVLWN